MRYSGITLPMLGVAVTLLFAAGSAEALRCHGDYNFGPTRFLTLITVEHGKILNIETSGYGY